MAGKHEQSDEPHATPPLPETLERERASEEAADSTNAGSLASTERRGRVEQTGADDPGSLPGTEYREREAEQEADAEEGRTESPSIPGTEHREREARRRDH